MSDPSAEPTFVDESGKVRFSPEFLNTYAGREPQWGPVGAITLVRTYLRFREDDNRMESWTECVTRCLEGNFNLVGTVDTEEMTRAFDLMWNLYWLPAGRSLWISGTKFAEENGSSLNNCVSGDTLVHTEDGLIPARDLAGKRVATLSDGGVYRMADWASYGEQELFKVVFSNGDEILATAGHEWITTKGGPRVATSDLVGHRVPLQHRTAFVYDEESYAEGIRHGLIYGDGTIQNHNPTKSVMLQFGDSQHLTQDHFEKWSIQRSARYPEGITYTGGHPAAYKQLPDEAEGQSYLRGFVAGLVAADGHVTAKGGSTYLHSSNFEALLRIRQLAASVGLPTTGIRMEREFNPWSGERAPVYCLTFAKSGMYDERMVLKKSHQDNMFNSPTPRRRTSVKVAAVLPTGRVEEVYCCNEPETHSWVAGPGYLTGNCWGISAHPQPYFEGGPKKCSMPFVLGQELLMLGGGIGFSATDAEVAKFPKVRRKVELIIVCDPKHPNYRECGAQDIPPRNVNHTYIRVKDERRGWTDSSRVVIDSHWKHGNYDYTLVVDVSDIRPYGAAIRGFGGVACGPGPFTEMLRSLNDLLNDRVGQKISAVDVVDMYNFIGKCIVAGNVRRSAELAGFSPENTPAREMKLDKAAMDSHRWASNNSIIIDNSFTDFEAIQETNRINGEPGIINIERCRNYGRYIDGELPNVDSSVVVTNPCGEVPLENGESCNLVEPFPALCLRDGVDVHEVLRIATRFAKRVTFAHHEWPVIREVVERNRRLGVSFGGWEDFKIMLEAQGVSREGRLALVDSYYQTVAAADREVSEELGCNTSIKLTTQQPSGTKSLINGSSPGRHAHYSKYYIRRIRFSSADPMIDVLAEAGFPSEPDARTPNTTVFSFPVKATTADLPGFRAASDYSLLEQCEDQMDIQTYWADNSVSSTLTFKEDEGDQIADILRKFPFKSTSLLPYSGHGYKQAPYEPIDEEEYDRLSGLVKYWPTVADFAAAREVDLLDVDCEGGACPVR